ncbi:MAG: thioredoxin reductase [Clostridiales bacterium]|jgi:thioredoxin reductase (NADPH)|nr:thioredoxin reductase [Clostridiales bacterium]MDK2933843.1 thioredoxin reductase [Clostridiales bacterium]
MLYDVIIIGRGPAGLSASLYTARGNMKTLILGKESALEKGKVIENYCCTEAGSGKDLVEKGIDQARSFGAEIVEEEVLDIKKDKYFTITTDKQQFQGKAVIIATGKARTQVPIDHLKRFEGNGVHYCAICDGFFYTGKKVGVLGYKDYAVHELRDLERTTKDIILYTNGNELQMSEGNKKYLQDKNISIHTKAIKSLAGDEFLEKIIFQDGSEETIEGLFVAYGSASSIDFARKLGILIENNNIKVDAEQKTSIEGVFAAGDCTGGLTQVATAVGQGAIAGQKAKAYVQNLN